MLLRNRTRRAFRLALLTFIIAAALTDGHDTRARQSPQQQPTANQQPASQQQQRPRRADDDDEVERVETESTNILLTALDRHGRFVTTLRGEDVRVLENGVPQQLSVFQRETELPLSLVVLVDTSASQEGVLADEKAAAEAFFDAVLRPSKDTAAVLSFTGLVKKEQDLTNDPALLRGAVERVKVLYTYESPDCDPESPTFNEERDLLCRTGVWHAVWFAVEEVLSRTPETTRRAVILLSDGDDTSTETESVRRVKREEAVAHAVRHNTAVYSVGIRDRDFPVGKLDRGALEKLSERTGGRAFFPSDRASLEAAFRQIEQELRSQYFISYTSSTRAPAGTFRAVKIEVVNPELRKQKLRLLHRQGYYARGAGSATKSNVTR